MQQMNFYCRSYCLLNVFRAPLCPSSGAREYHTSGCCLSYLVLGFQVVGMVWTHNPQLHTIPTTCNNHLYDTLELLMMGIMVPETRWASNKICNKNSSVASSWHFISTFGRYSPLHIDKEAGGVVDSVWTLSICRRSLDTAENRTAIFHMSCPQLSDYTDRWRS